LGYLGPESAPLRGESFKESEEEGTAKEMNYLLKKGGAGVRFASLLKGSQN